MSGHEKTLVLVVFAALPEAEYSFLACCRGHGPHPAAALLVVTGIAKTQPSGVSLMADWASLIIGRHHRYLREEEEQWVPVA